MGRIPLLVVALVGAQLALAAPAFALGPSSMAKSPEFSKAATFDIPYTTSDDVPLSSVTAVELYAKGPADAGFSKVATDTSPDTPDFRYSGTQGDGSYSFYTRATDSLGNQEPDRGAADGSTLVDTTPPTSQASAPSSSSGGPIPITYSAGDATSGVQSVELWVQRPGSSSYTLTDTDTSPDSPSFSYGPAAGDGTYAFYTVAIDRLGNREAPPAAADATTVVKSPASTTSTTQVQSPQQPRSLVASVSLLKGQDLNTVLRKGLALELLAYRQVSLKLQLSVSPRTAKALHMRNPRVAVHNWQVIMPKVYSLRLRLTRTAIRRMRKVKRVHFELRSVLSTTGGNSIATNPLTFGRP